MGKLCWEAGELDGDRDGVGVPQGGRVYDSQHVGGAPASPDMSGPVVVTHVGAPGHAGSVPVRLMDMM